jgi:hypothetical protein
MEQPEIEQTGVSVKTDFPFNQFSLRRMKTNIKIDRRSLVLPWGSHFFALNPGHHEIEIGVRTWGRIIAKNHIAIELTRGQTISIHYRTRYFAFQAGSISIL